MFNKSINVTIMTRTKNEDNFKIERLISTWKKPATTPEIKCNNNNEIEIRFVLDKSVVKKFEKDLQLLNFIGIEGKMEIK